MAQTVFCNADAELRAHTHTATCPGEPTPSPSPDIPRVASDIPPAGRACAPRTDTLPHRRPDVRISRRELPVAAAAPSEAAVPQSYVGMRMAANMAPAHVMPARTATQWPAHAVCRKRPTIRMGTHRAAARAAAIVYGDVAGNLPAHSPAS